MVLKIVVTFCFLAWGKGSAADDIGYHCRVPALFCLTSVNP